MIFSCSCPCGHESERWTNQCWSEAISLQCNALTSEDVLEGLIYDLCHCFQIGLTHLTPRMGVSFSAEYGWEAHGWKIRWLISSEWKEEQGLLCKVGLAHQGSRTSHVWWFCKVGTATAQRCKLKAPVSCFTDYKEKSLIRSLGGPQSTCR